MAFDDSEVAARVIDETGKIRDAANRHEVPVIDTDHAIKDKLLGETYIYSDSYIPHHSRAETKSLPI
jgi:hypothetical protein